MLIKSGINIADLLGITGWEITSYSLNELKGEVTLHVERGANTYYQFGYFIQTNVCCVF